MTTAEQTPVTHLLDGMLCCQNCGAAMESTDSSPGQTPMYACLRSQGGCGATAIPAEPLVQLVVTTVIRAALEGGNAQQVAEIVQEDTRERIIAYDEGGYTPETRLSPDLSIAVPEMRGTRQPDAAEDIEPLRRLNRYWNLTGDRGQIAEYALDPDTYLRPSNVRTTRDIIETAVDEVSVGPRSAIIRYRFAMPPGSGDQGKFQEVVDLASRR
ncbi:MAG: zinc ribbon domain-containing protein [Chloroflexota bacterium]|nr:zinc ribbon domain-containing protein [Chloroflexota bacterium]